MDTNSVNGEELTPSPGTEPDHDAVVVGAGFAGLYALHRLRDEVGLSTKVIEKADDVGGTWYWNRYPGAQCDSQSYVYCYSFSDEIIEEWDWDRRFPEQSDVLAYLRFVAEKLDLRPDIEFGTEVTAATFDEERGRWEIRTDAGETVTARFLVTAVGGLSEPYVPEFEGRESFEGFSTHPARWPREDVSFAGERVAVIGTGSTGIQIVQAVARSDPEQLTVFQRTPNYATPKRDRPLEEAEKAEIRANYDEIMEKAHSSGSGYPFEFSHETAEDLTMADVEEILEPRWQNGGFEFFTAFADLRENEATSEKVGEFVRNKIRETVDDPETAEKLVPTDHYIGTKRPPQFTDYYGAFNREHVSLVDVTENPIERITPDGIRTAGGHHDFDVIIYATGFDAVTGALLGMDIEGRDGVTLEEKWSDGPRTYLGLAVHGFPNLFTITGPQSPSLLSNVPVPIEHHVEWISDAIERLTADGVPLIEPTRRAEEAWAVHNRETAEETLYTTADSYYRGANIPGKPTVFTLYAGGVDTYHDVIREVADRDYEGFALADSVADLGRTGSTPTLSAFDD
jgi:cyclohexanone monooxygenase